jgi:hypothetical protein
MVISLVTIGFCVLAQMLPGFAVQSTDLIPHEERVQVRQLANRVKTYVQQRGGQPHSGSFRVILKKPAGDEDLYVFEGDTLYLNNLEDFFDDCLNKAKHHDENDAVPSTPSQGRGNVEELAVIAVGDFSEDEVFSLIKRKFSEIELPSKDLSTDPIQVDSDSAMRKVAIKISFFNQPQSIHTYRDLKACWQMFMLQELYQQRSERCARSLEAAWIHPRPHLFYPINGYAFSSDEMVENLLSFLIWQVEAIRTDGFSEEEFYMIKRNMLNQLQYLIVNMSQPENTDLASYYADQFLIGDQCLNYEAFLTASFNLVQEMECDQLFPYIDTLFGTERRSIHVTYPEMIASHGLAKDSIEDLIAQVTSLASFYRDSEIDEKEIEQVKAQSGLLTVQSLPNDSERIFLANQFETAEFRLANNDPVIQRVNVNGSIDPYYQLPLNDKEKRTIRKIFTNMAEKNIIQLALEKRTMEKKGKSVNHVHPLRFIGYIFSCDLKNCMRKIAKSSFKWDAFVDGFSRRMKEELANNNLYKHIPGFCQEVGANPEEVTRFIDKKDWEGLVKSLIN